MGVVLVARNREKLENVKRELLEMRGDAKIRIVVADFKNSLDFDFYSKITKEVEDIEISMLVNNVGIDYFSNFHEVSESCILDHVKVNCLPMVNLTRHFIPYFSERFKIAKKKSAVLNVGSFAGVLPCVYF